MKNRKFKKKKYLQVQMQWSFSLNNLGVCLSIQSWRWCLRCCSVVVSAKGTHKVEQNCTKKKNKKKPTKYPKFKCNTVSVSFSACRCSSVVLSSMVGREKKKQRVWRQFSEWYLRLRLACPLLSACCCWRHYLCRSLGWALHSSGPTGFVYSEFSCVEAAATSFPLSKHTGGGDTAPTFSGLHVCLQLTWKVGLPPSPVEFSSLCHSHKPSHSWLLGTHHCSRRNLSDPPGLFIYSSGKDSLPPIFSAQCAPPSFLRVFIVLIAY
jgi:hypothetical protein